ncbi:MAG: hypothetical protein KC656_13810, partial [Myxococcales bacterium]|nr:hypothetical protein [Myxococcales bacterium]
MTRRLLALAVAVVALQAVLFGYFHEDAYISLRYARNAARGYGLVFDPGAPPVEGITNLLWTVALVPAALVGLEKGAAVLLGVLATLGLLVRVATTSGVLVGSLGPWAALLLACCLPLGPWAVAGLETPAVAWGTWELLLAASLADRRGLAIVGSLLFLL